MVSAVSDGDALTSMSHLIVVHTQRKFSSLTNLSLRPTGETQYRSCVQWPFIPLLTFYAGDLRLQIVVNEKVVAVYFETVLIIDHNLLHRLARLDDDRLHLVEQCSDC